MSVFLLIMSSAPHLSHPFSCVLSSFFSLFLILQTDYESRKPVIARDISIARAKNDDETAKQLCAELDALSHLSYNPLGNSSVISCCLHDISHIVSHQMHNNRVSA